MSGDTIHAPATGAGRAGVQIVRLSGPRSGAILAQLTGQKNPAPRVATLAKLAHQGVLLDEMQQQMLRQMRAADPAELMKNFIPGYAAFEEFQKLFYAGPRPGAVTDRSKG